MNRLFSISDELLSHCNASFTRYLYNDITLNGRLTGIFGGRGVGKTTLILQLMKYRLGSGLKSFYVDLEDFYFSYNSLLDLARDFYLRGGNYLFLDNFHKYPQAVQEISIIIDELPQLKVVFASSLPPDNNIAWEKLAKFAKMYDLPGLSYREFLELKYQLAFPVILFDELIELNRNPGAAVLNRIRPLQYFDEYLEEGYYPISHESALDYKRQLSIMLNNNLEGDLASVYHIDYYSVEKIKRILYDIAVTGPRKPKIESLADKIGSTRDSLLKFLFYLIKAGLIIGVYKEGEVKIAVKKPQRLYLHNSNLIGAISQNLVSREAKYETFLMNQLMKGHNAYLADEGNLIINGEFYFKLEWRSYGELKKRPQADSYTIDNSIEFQSGTRIPLWMFGFLY